MSARGIRALVLHEIAAKHRVRQVVEPVRVGDDVEAIADRAADGGRCHAERWYPRVESSTRRRWPTAALVNP